MVQPKLCEKLKNDILKLGITFVIELQAKYIKKLYFGTVAILN